MQRHYPAEQRNQLGHKLSVEPEGRDRPVSHHYTNEPHKALVTLWDHRSGHPSVHAALLPVRQPPPAQPGRRVPAGLLHWGAGGPSRAADAGTADSSRHPAAKGLNHSWGIHVCRWINLLSVRAWETYMVKNIWTLKHYTHMWSLNFLFWHRVHKSTFLSASALRVSVFSPDVEPAAGLFSLQSPEH